MTRGWAEYAATESLHKCHSYGQCDHLVPIGVLYCCEPCATAWESVPRYDPEHTRDCDERKNMRDRLNERP